MKAFHASPLEQTHVEAEMLYSILAGLAMFTGALILGGLVFIVIFLS